MNQSKKNAIADKLHNGLEATWITPQINGLIMSLSFGLNVIDLFSSSLSLPEAPLRFGRSYMCMSACLCSCMLI